MEIPGMIEKAMAILISPDTKPIASTSSQSNLHKQLTDKMSEFDEKLELDFKELLSELQTKYNWEQTRRCEDIAWKYTQYCVCVLECFVEATLKAGQNCILSVNTQKMVESLVQFIAYLGICPNLIPGVGIPVAKRSKFAALVENRIRFAYDCDMQLICCIKAIISCTKVISLSAIIFTKHLNDLLASLLQICHAPRKKIPPSTDEDTTKHSPVPTLSDDDKLYCQQELAKLLERTYQPLLVQELLLLQSGSSPKAPRWIKQVCGSLLSDILLKPKGVMAIIKGSLQTTSGSPSGRDWQKCDGLGRLIANCPRKIAVVEDYYKLISKQVLDLLHANDETLKAAVCHVAASCITAMYNQHPKLTRQYLIQPLQQPLLNCLVSEDTPHANIRVIVEEKGLSQCLQDMHQVYMYNGDPNSKLRGTLQPILHPLFHLYCHTKKGISPIRSILRDILTAFFKSHKDSECITLLYCLALPNKADSILPQMREDIHFVNDSDGGVAIVINDFQRESPDNDDEILDNKMDCLVELIQVMNNEKLTADFFLRVLKELTKILAEDFWSPRTSTNTTEGKTLMEIEKNLDHMSERYNHAMNVLSLISAMCGELGTAVLQQTLHVLEFAETTLQRMCEICEQSGDELDTLVADTLTMTLGLVAMLYQPLDKMESEVKGKFQTMTLVLKRLSEVCPNAFLQQMAADLYITVATHHAVTPNLDRHQERAFSKTTKGAKSDSKSAEKVKRSNGKDKEETYKRSEGDGTSAAGQHKADQSSHKHIEFDDLCEQLNDPTVPVKAHAIRALTKLLVKRDTEALDQKDRFLQVFQESVESDDSYLYLSAIQGLVALVDISPQMVLPILYKQFSDGSSHPERIETRMKIGEALVRSTRVLGAILPAYVKPLIGTLLIGVKDSDPIIRASSLSNVAEICYVIKVAVSPMIHEIVSCVRDIVKTDEESEVRRAAVHVIRQLLSALQDDSLQVLQDVMKEMYSVLKYAVQHDKDEITRIHASLALEELDSIMKTFIFPKQSLTKKITVLP